MRMFCSCGHSEAWHTTPNRQSEMDKWALVVYLDVVCGDACDWCDCKGYFRKLTYQGAER